MSRRHPQPGFLVTAACPVSAKFVSQPPIRAGRVSYLSLQMTLWSWSILTSIFLFQRLPPFRVRSLQSLAATSPSLWANRSLCHSDLSHGKVSSGPPYSVGEEGNERWRVRASASRVLPGSTLAVTVFSLWVNRSLCHSDLSHEYLSSGKPPYSAGERWRATATASASGVLGVRVAADAHVSKPRAPRILAAASSERRTSKAPPTLLASTSRSSALSTSSSPRTASNRSTCRSPIAPTPSSHCRKGIIGEPGEQGEPGEGVGGDPVGPLGPLVGPLGQPPTPPPVGTCGGGCWASPAASPVGANGRRRSVGSGGRMPGGACIFALSIWSGYLQSVPAKPDATFLQHRVHCWYPVAQKKWRAT